MSIHRKLKVILWLAVALGTALAAIFLIVQRGEAVIHEREQLLCESAERMFRLAMFGHEMRLQPDASRPVEQWRATHHDLGEMLRRAEFPDVEDEAAIQRLMDGHARLGGLFEQLRALADPDAPVDPELVEEQRARLNDQMNFTIQAMIGDTRAFQRTFREQATAYRQEMTGLGVALAVLLTGGIALLAYMTGSSITGPLLRLREGTAIVGAGNLDHRVGTVARDEVGALSRDFDTMLDRLQQVTASREELVREVERRVRTEAALRKSEESLRIAQAIAHLGHWEWDIQSGEVKWSEETYRILGYQPHALEPNHELFLQSIHPEDRARVEKKLKGTAKGEGFDVEYRIIVADGAQRSIHARGQVLCLGAGRETRVIGTIQEVGAEESMSLLGVIQDITERKALEQRLEHEARTDALTGSANRRHFFELAAHEIARAKRYDRDLGLLMLDLDLFKRINDRHGHQVGDRVLQKLVEVCSTSLREEDVVGRLGGEEFAILLPETGAEKALDAAERLREAVAGAEVPVNGKTLRFTTSIGVTTLQGGDSGVDPLLRRADRALYAAKEAGRNRVRSG